MPTGAAVAVIGVEIDAGAVTLGFSRWTRTPSTRADLVGATDVSTRAAVVGIGLLVGTCAIAVGLA